MNIQYKNINILENIKQVLYIFCATIFVTISTISLYKLYEHIRIELNYKQDI